MADTDERARDAEHHLNLWLSNDQPIYRQALALLTKYKDPARLKAWAATVLYGHQSIHTALCRHVVGYESHTSRYAQASWDVLKDTRQRVSRVVFDRIDAERFADMIDSDNELGWKAADGQQ